MRKAREKNKQDQESDERDSWGEANAKVFTTD